MFLSPLRLTLRIFNRMHAPLLQTRATLTWTRNTSNNRKSSTRSSSRTTRNSSRNKNRTTSGWHNSRLVQRETSKSNRSTSSRHSKWSKDTRSSSKTCRTDSSREAEISPSPTSKGLDHLCNRTERSIGSTDASPFAQPRRRDHVARLHMHGALQTYLQ